MEKIEIATTEGVCDARLFVPPSGSGPAVIFCMDGIGLREGLFQMGRRLAEAGYLVLMPNLYWRFGQYAPFDPKTVFNPDSPDRQRLFSMVRGVQPAQLMADVEASLGWLAKDPRVKGSRAGATGYCLGGGVAFRAAAMFPDRIAAAASFHGARLVTDAPDSPHLLAERIRGALYFGVAEIDTGHTAETSKALTDALTKAGVAHELETYPKVAHGFCVPDTPVYDAGAAERAWSKLLAFFGRELSKS